MKKFNIYWKNPKTREFVKLSTTFETKESAEEYARQLIKTGAWGKNDKYKIINE